MENVHVYNWGEQLYLWKMYMFIIREGSYIMENWCL